MVFKKGQAQANGQIKEVRDRLKELLVFAKDQTTVNDSFVEIAKGIEDKIVEIDELGVRLERTDWALLDYIKQQEHVIQSMERRLYNLEKVVLNFAAQAPEAA